MIIWWNSRITDKRWAQASGKLPDGWRDNLVEESRIDVFKYMISSYASLGNLISKAFFNLQLDQTFEHRKQELIDHIHSEFGEGRYRIQWFKCTTIPQYLAVTEEFNQVGDTVIFPSRNDDHPFIDSSPNLLKSGLQYLEQDPNPDCMLNLSHWIEVLKEALTDGAEITPCGNFISFYKTASTSIYALKMTFWNRIMENNMHRTDHIESPEQIDYHRSKVYVPTKELARHYDGYKHVRIDPNICPALEIPKGFFNNDIVIKYGFDRRDNDCVNVNPSAEFLYAVHPEGTDYKFCLEDLPLCWKNRIKQIIINQEIDHKMLIEKRNQWMIAMKDAIPIPTVSPPIELIRNHLL